MRDYKFLGGDWRALNRSGDVLLFSTRLHISDRKVSHKVYKRLTFYRRVYRGNALARNWPAPFL